MSTSLRLLTTYLFPAKGLYIIVYSFTGTVNL